MRSIGAGCLRMKASRSRAFCWSCSAVLADSGMMAFRVPGHDRRLWLDGGRRQIFADHDMRIGAAEAERAGRGLAPLSSVLALQSCSRLLT